ncbi:hypothetical protein QOT17_022715 [Balamuthia mandrillaris]
MKPASLLLPMVVVLGLVTGLMAVTPQQEFSVQQQFTWRKEDGGNGHHYELYIGPVDSTWEDANAAAGRMISPITGEKRGHLATIESAEEAEVVGRLLDSFFFSHVYILYVHVGGRWNGSAWSWRGEQGSYSPFSSNGSCLDEYCPEGIELAPNSEEGDLCLFYIRKRNGFDSTPFYVYETNSCNEYAASFVVEFPDSAASALEQLSEDSEELKTVLGFVLSSPHAFLLPKDEHGATNFGVQDLFLRFRDMQEVAVNGSVVATQVLSIEGWNRTLVSSSDPLHLIFWQRLGNGALVELSCLFHSKETEYSFAGVDFTVAPNVAKWTLHIQDWPFKSEHNDLRFAMKLFSNPPILRSSADVGSNLNCTPAAEEDAMSCLALESSAITTTIQLFKQAFLDDSYYVPITYELDRTYTELQFTFPSFQSLLYDPDFSVLLTGSSDGDGDEDGQDGVTDGSDGDNGDGEEMEGKDEDSQELVKILVPVSLVLTASVIVVVGVAVFVLMRMRKRREKKEQLGMVQVDFNADSSL